MRALGSKAVLAVAIVGGLLAGCSSGSGDGDNGSSQSKNTSSGDRNLVSGASEGPSVAPSAVAAGMGAGSAKDGEFPRTVGHFKGRTEIRSAPKKIAALSTGQLDGLAAAALVYVLAWRHGMQPSRFVLTGVGIGVALSAVVQLYLTDSELAAAEQVKLWLTGSLNGRGWEQAGPLARVLLLSLPALVWAGRALETWKHRGRRPVVR
ncbi:iron chelate uptake ABC transporter family permease subunit, partial [Streptomyces mirabilis]|uniref:iron chelate uptake ABC transporter family permease subunit n=1 Tax=Streptomyces mirabilis TaxID=68239 RepID=UPI0036381A0A